MKTTIDFDSFRDAFVKFGRENTFSHDGKKALFEYIEEYEESTGESLELDVIGLCCEYDEYEWQYIADYYRIDLSCFDTDAEKIQAVREYLEYNTCLVGETEPGFFLYVAF